MQLRHLQSITQPSEGIQKVTALCWAPNGKKLAVCTTDRVVLMFDEDGVRRDKFSTKPADKVLFTAQIDSLIFIDGFCIIGTKKLCGKTNDVLSSVGQTCHCSDRQYGVYLQNW